MPRGSQLLHSSRIARYLLGLILFGLALAGRFALIGVLPPSGFPFLTFFPAVLLTAYLAGLKPGLLVSALSTVAAWYFFIAPTYAFAGLSRGDQIALIFFTGILVVDCVVIHLMNKAIAKALSTSKELRESEERMLLATEATKVGIWEWNVLTDEIRWNAVMFQIYGIDPTGDGAVHYRDWTAAVLPEELREQQAILQDTVLRAGSSRRAFRIRRRNDGAVRYVEAVETVRTNDQGQAVWVVGTNLDVTDRKQALADLERARQVAQDASASKSEFLANMSHEIRTPMTAILGYAELLSGLDLPAEARDYLKPIRLNGDHLLEIINDILDLSKIEAGKLELNRERFDPTRVVEDVRNIMKLRANEKDLRLTVRYEGKLPALIESDAKRLKQILINLVGNAIKFTVEGSVDIVARFGKEPKVNQEGAAPVQYVTNAPTEPPSGASGSAPPESTSGYLQFDIIDTGIGMNAEQKSRLFKPFSQGDSSVSRNFGGTGLGLAISRRLANLLGGDMRGESTFGVGSTFSFTIKTGAIGTADLVEPHLAIKPLPPVTYTDEQPKLSCHVLVVDDRRDIRYLSSRILTKAGATVDEAEDGQLGLDFVLARLGPGKPPDLILLDMQMPNLDGYQTAERLRAAGFVGPIVALTADAMQGDMKRCLEAGCNAYLSKPINAKRLLDLVLQLTQVDSK